MDQLPIFATGADLEPTAHALATELGVLPVTGTLPTTGLAMRIDAHGLALVDLATAAVLRCDFVSGRQGYRLRHADPKQALPRAVGLGRGRRPQVLDATAGLGRDGLLLAALGCRVLLVERVPVIHALLRDGLERLRARSVSGVQVLDRVELRCAQARDLLQVLPDAERPEVIYLDPMHPPRRGSALVRQEMRLLRAVAGADDDAEQLLPVARRVALERVVVKRPAQAGPLDGAVPDWSLGGRTTRYDVYRSAG